MNGANDHDNRTELTEAEREFLRKVLQQHIWATTSNKEAIAAQELIDKLERS